MHKLHGGLTIAVPIKLGHSNQLRQVLMLINDPANKCLNNFDSSETTLFANGVILPAQDYHGELLPATFIFATTYCGPVGSHIEDLVTTCKKALQEMFAHCVGFQQRTLTSKEEVADYLKAHIHKGAFNSRYNCITKREVEGEKKLRTEIEDYIDKLKVLIEKRHAAKEKELTPVQIKTLIERHIKVQGHEYEWAYKPARKNGKEFIVVNRQEITVASLIAILLVSCAIVRPDMLYGCKLQIVILYILGAVGFLIVIYLLITSFITREKNITAPRPTNFHIRAAAATQLRPVLNEMTAAAPLKKGILRKYFYASSLRVVHFLGSIFMNVPTVSSIRWLVVNDKKRLLFLSNFTNTTDFYVRDFLNGGTPRGVNFIFSNDMGFPDSKFMFRDGITKDPEGYMNAVHTGQQPTGFWYAHQPNLTVDMIQRNRKIRNGLFKKMNNPEAVEWLKLF
jgi:hypothetical protein